MGGTIRDGEPSALDRLDGAHNRDSARCLREALMTCFQYRRLILVLGISANKNLQRIIEELAPLATMTVATRAMVPRAAAAARGNLAAKWSDHVIAEEDTQGRSHRRSPRPNRTITPGNGIVISRRVMPNACYLTSWLQRRQDFDTGERMTSSHSVEVYLRSGEEVVTGHVSRRLWRWSSMPYARVPDHLLPARCR
jgi:hypothetical protein